MSCPPRSERLRDRLLDLLSPQVCRQDLAIGSDEESRWNGRGAQRR